MVQIFMYNTLNILKNKIKKYVKIYFKHDTVIVDIIDYNSNSVYRFTLYNIYDKLNTGYNSTRFAHDILNDYKEHVLNQFFY